MKTGDKYRDSQGDTWTVQYDGRLMWDESATYDEPLFHSLTELEADYGPIRPVGNGHDPVNHPQHYTGHPSGIECIQVTEHMNFNLGNATKYLWRAGEKGDAVEDLRKSVWYIEREIARLGAVS